MASAIRLSNALGRHFLSNKHSAVNKAHKSNILAATTTHAGHNSAEISTTTDFPEFQDLTHIKTHEDLYRFSIEDSETFWSRLARSRLAWSKDFTAVSNHDFKTGKIRWFEGGALNASGKF